MAEQQNEMVQLFRNLATQMAGVSTAVGAQGVAQLIKSFEGDPKQYKEWIKSVEKYAVLTGLDNNRIKLVAYQASRGAVSGFLQRYLRDNVNATWDQVKTELASRFAEVTDPQHALMLLRNIRQKMAENVQVYAERLLSIAEDSFPGGVGAGGNPAQVQAIERQLVDQFVDGLANDGMKMKVMRGNPNTLQAAVALAMEEQNLRKRFDLRTKTPRMNDRIDRQEGPVPMEIDHMRPRRRCNICNRFGHIPKDCRARERQVNVIENRPRQKREDVICWSCQGKGHFARECQNRIGRNIGRRINNAAPQTDKQNQEN